MTTTTAPLQNPHSPGSKAFWDWHHARIAALDAEQREVMKVAGVEAARRRWKAIPIELTMPINPKHSGFCISDEYLQYCRKWDPASGRGIGLVGSPGIGKTRVLIEILGRLPVYVPWLYLPVWQFCECVALANSRNTQEAQEARHLLQKARRVKVLLWDDIGDLRATDACVQEAKAMVDYRVHHRLPLLWTGNPSQSALISKYGKDEAMLTQMQAVVRRLTGFSWMPGARTEAQPSLSLDTPTN